VKYFYADMTRDKSCISSYVNDNHFEFNAGIFSNIFYILNEGSNIFYDTLETFLYA